MAVVAQFHSRVFLYLLGLMTSSGVGSIALDMNWNDMIKCSGGWRCVKPYSRLEASLLPRNSNISFCDLPTELFDEDGFEQQFKRLSNQSLPTVLKNISRDVLSKWRMPWRRASFYKGKGRKSVFRAGFSSNIVENGGNGYWEGPASTLADEVWFEHNSLQEPFYIFDRDHPRVDMMKLPTIGGMLNGSIVTGGGPGSGTVYHLHAKVYTLQLFGRKRWFLFPPGVRPPGGLRTPSMLLWTLDAYPRLFEPFPEGANWSRPIECIQEPGTILVLPDFWQHAVLNVDDAIGVSMQSQEPSDHKHSELYKDVEKANQYVAFGRYQEAEQMFDTLLEADPLFLDARVEKAKIWEKRGEYAKATSVYEEMSTYGCTKAFDQLLQLPEHIVSVNEKVRWAEKYLKLLPRLLDVDNEALPTTRLREAHDLVLGFERKKPLVAEEETSPYNAMFAHAIIVGLFEPQTDGASEWLLDPFAELALQYGSKRVIFLRIRQDEYGLALADQLYHIGQADMPTLVIQVWDENVDLQQTISFDKSRWPNAVSIKEFVKAFFDGRLHKVGNAEL